MWKPKDTLKTVRLSHSINDEERTYVTMRKTLIKKWLKNQNIDCELEDVPNIALLGSGGGERAAVGMLGSLCQLAQDDLLGSLLYMCGVSGSTWCMSSLYSNPAESLSESCDEIIKKLKGPTVDLSKAVEWLKLRKEQNQDFNLTDFWGAFTASYFMKEMNTCCLSEDAHRKIIKPYPIYSAIELDCYRQGYTKGVWFEMTPHESGFSGLGAFVPTSCLGSQFEGGTLREKRKEIDMVLLQGICGSAIADGQMNNDEVVKKIWGLLGGGKNVSNSGGKNVSNSGGKNVSNSGEDDMRLEFVSRGEVKVCNCLPSQVGRCVSELIEYAEDPDALKTWEVITTLEQLLKGHVSSKGEMLWNMDAERWQRNSLMERKEYIEKVSLELILTSDSWTKDWEDQSCTCNGEDDMRLEFVSRGEVKVCNCLPSQVGRCVSELIEYTEDPDALKTWEVITTLEQLLKGHVSSKGEMLWNMDAERWQINSLMERKEFIEKVSLELILTSDSWTKDWEDQSCTCNAKGMEATMGMTARSAKSSSERITNPWVPDKLWIVQNIFPLVIKWEWGTVSNFLFKIQDTNVPSSIASKEKIHLVDAGLKINSPYPPILRTSRKVDLIISLDFSAGDPFETVRSAKTYALQQEVPFPPVKQSVWTETDHPEGCYVFEGQSPEVPTIMHMPLFNLQNCQDEEEIQKEREKYTTFHQHYDASEIQHIMEKAKDNLKNNKNRILEQILMAVKRRKNRKSVAQ